LFPDLYTNLYGVKEQDSETKVGSSMFEHSQILMHRETLSVERSVKKQKTRPRKEKSNLRSNMTVTTADAVNVTD